MYLASAPEIFVCYYRSLYGKKIMEQCSEKIHKRAVRKTIKKSFSPFNYDSKSIQGNPITRRKSRNT